MASEIEICNRGLIKLGEKTILSLGDDVKAARLCRSLYAPTRDYLLRSYPWNFAIKRTEMPQNAAGPLYDYTYAYKLPSDCLRVIIPSRNIWAYGIEGDTLVTDYPSGFLKYVACIEDPNLFDVSFSEALACKLAAELAIPLTDNDARHANMVQLFDMALVDAKKNDSMEDGPKWITSEEWLDSRRVGVAGPKGIHRGQPK